MLPMLTFILMPTLLLGWYVGVHEVLISNGRDHGLLGTYQSYILCSSSVIDGFEDIWP